jgi:hypothetical protein
VNRLHDTAPDQVDVLLRRQAEQVADAHQPDPQHPRRCGNLGCRGTTWPCPARRLAEHATRIAHPAPRRPPAATPARHPETHHIAQPTDRRTSMAHDTAPSTAAGTGDSFVHPRPDRLRIGDFGVFAHHGLTGTGHDPEGFPVGYRGRLVDWWNGWAVWSTTRDVVEAMVTEQHRLRHICAGQLAADGYTGADLATRLDSALPPMYFDGTDLVVDEHANFDDDPLTRISPDHQGRYIPMGWHWTWVAVDPARCDRIAGHLPPPPTR